MIDLHLKKATVHENNDYRDFSVQVNDTVVSYGLVTKRDMTLILTELKEQVDAELSSLVGHDVNGG